MAVTPLSITFGPARGEPLKFDNPHSASVC
jgi:hypothetical protein